MFGNHKTTATIIVVPFLVTRGPSLGVRGVSASVSVMVHKRFTSLLDERKLKIAWFVFTSVA